MAPLACAAATLAPLQAFALDPPSVHATATAAHALSAPQSDELGWGGGGGIAVELPIVPRWLGVQLAGDALGVSSGAPPKDPSLAPRSGGALVSGTAGVRGHLFGFWVDGGGGVAVSGSEARPTFSTHVGYDVRLGRRSWWMVGPFAGYALVTQPKDGLRPEDAHFGVFGLQISLSPPASSATPTVVERLVKRAPPPRDRDGDGVPDDVDACADAAGVPSVDRGRNGCPSDMDGDGIADVDDTCVDVPGRRTGDPLTHGCPDSEIRLAEGALVVPERIQFDFDSPEVRADSVAVVKKIADFVAARSGVVALEIEGHADEKGSVTYNQALSLARAESVKRLLEELGVRCPISVRAFGKLRPRAIGHSELDQQENRRVEFLVHTSGDEVEVPHASK